MSDNVEITQIKIKLGEKEIELSLADCEKLYDVLGELFKVKVEKEYVPSYPITTPVVPYQPIWIIPPQDVSPWWPNYPTITCSVENKTLSVIC